MKINTKPRELWAIDHADTIDKEVAALLVPHPVDEHVWRRVGIRSSVLAEKWKNVPPEEQQKFVMLKQAFEEGTASVEDQAKYVSISSTQNLLAYASLADTGINIL